MTENSAPEPPAPRAPRQPQAPDEETLALAEKLFQAARDGDIGLLRAYLDAGAPASMTNAAGDSLLMLAAYHGHAETVQLILEHGAEADKANDRGQTPLAGAAFKGYTDVAKSCWRPVLIRTPAHPRRARRRRCSPAPKSSTFWKADLWKM